MIPVWTEEEYRNRRDEIAEDLDLYSYLHVTHHINPNTDPLDVELFWDEPGFGSMAKVNLREEYMEILKDDPERHAPIIPNIVAALRSLADDIEAIK